MDIGKKIKNLRSQKGITQETLADLLSVSPQAVSKWETGAAMPDILLLPEWPSPLASPWTSCLT